MRARRERHLRVSGLGWLAQGPVRRAALEDALSASVQGASDYVFIIRRNALNLRVPQVQEPEIRILKHGPLPLDTTSLDSRFDEAREVKSYSMSNDGGIIEFNWGDRKWKKISDSTLVGDTLVAVQSTLKAGKCYRYVNTTIAMWLIFWPALFYVVYAAVQSVADDSSAGEQDWDVPHAVNVAVFATWCVTGLVGLAISLIDVQGGRLGYLNTVFPSWRHVVVAVVTTARTRLGGIRLAGTLKTIGSGLILAFLIHKLGWG